MGPRRRNKDGVRDLPKAAAQNPSMSGWDRRMRGWDGLRYRGNVSPKTSRPDGRNGRNGRKRHAGQVHRAPRSTAWLRRMEIMGEPAAPASSGEPAAPASSGAPHDRTNGTDGIRALGGGDELRPASSIRVDQRKPRDLPFSDAPDNRERLTCPFRFQLRALQGILSGSPTL